MDPYLPRRLSRLLLEARFSLVRREAIALLNAGYDPNTFSAGLMGFVTEFVAGRQGLTEADAQAWAEDLKALGGDRARRQCATASWGAVSRRRRADRVVRVLRA